MLVLFKEINKKVNGIIRSFVGTGVVLLMLSILIFWTEMAVRVFIGFFVLVLAYAFLTAAYKIWRIKSDVEKHFKI